MPVILYTNQILLTGSFTSLSQITPLGNLKTLLPIDLKAEKRGDIGYEHECISKYIYNSNFITIIIQSECKILKVMIREAKQSLGQETEHPELLHWSF